MPLTLEDLGIAVQHQTVCTHLPTFEPIEEAHAEQVCLHLAMRYHERRHRTLDELADRETIKRQPGSFGVTAGRLDVDVVFQEFERQARGLWRSRMSGPPRSRRCR